VLRRCGISVAAVTALIAAAAPAHATPVCTDGHGGGPPLSVCGGRIFPEAALARAYIQMLPDPSGFAEYQHGIEYLAKKYPRWVSVFTLRSRYGDDAVSAGHDGARSYEPADTNDGHDIWVVKVTDHAVPDAGKRPLFFSLSVHGNERGGLEGGVRTAEDLAMAATDGGKVSDGVDNYESATGRKPEFHSYEVRDVLARQAVYFVDFNPDGWAVGDLWADPPSLYERGNGMGTDLNRQMPTVGRIDESRNPLQESEMLYGERFMREVANAAPGGRMAHGADVHGELISQAYVDIMYPAGQFDSVAHRRLMAIAERTKSAIDDTLYAGIADLVEEATSGNEGEAAQPAIPTKPAHWATVWDTLGYTDTGFIGDYLATDLAVTGMDYEFFLNHTVPDKVWNVYLQENFINGTRALIKTAMAYSLYQEQEFSEKNVVVDPVGRAGYVVNPKTVSDSDANGPGKRPGIGPDGKRPPQRPYNVTNQRWFRDTSRLMPRPFVRLAAADVAAAPATLDAVDTLVLADLALPDDTRGRKVDPARYFANLKAWVQRGGNLVLTDRALHALGELGVLPKDAVRSVTVYQPYANIRDFSHPLVRGLRSNARQLVEAAILGYGIGDDASPMTVVDRSAWEGAGGKTVATTGNNSGESDEETTTSIGELKLGGGLIRIVGGALPTPTEENDHRYGLRDYALTYTGLFVMENALKHDVAALGNVAPRPAARCVSGRRLRVVVPKVRGARLRSATVRVNGRRVRVQRRGGRLVAVIDLRRRAGKALRVTIVRRTSRGRSLTIVRRYRVCPSPR
jgi:hypothetical protein